jgi:hypothetical protein
MNNIVQSIQEFTVEKYNQFNTFDDKLKARVVAKTVIVASVVSWAVKVATGDHLLRSLSFTVTAIYVASDVIARQAAKFGITRAAEQLVEGGFGWVKWGVRCTEDILISAVRAVDTPSSFDSKKVKQKIAKEDLLICIERILNDVWLEIQLTMTL